MKNLLIGTTALVSIFAGAAFADAPATVTGPSVSLGGVVDAQFGTRSQKGAYKNQSLTENVKHSKLHHDARVYLKAQNKADAGFTYGGVVGLKTNAQAKTGKSSNDLDKTYLFLESDFGRFEIGSNYNAVRTMSVHGTSIARATGGADGDWARYINLGGVTYLEAPTHLGDANRGDIIESLTEDDLYSGKAAEESRKITYYTPRFSGLQLGLSFTPDTANVGDFSYNWPAKHRNVKNHFSGGLNYAGQFDQVAFNASLTGEMGEAKRLTSDPHKRTLKGWSAGASVTYAGFSVAGSYGATGKKFTYDATNVANSKNTKFWTAGAAYVQGPVGVSVTYLESKYMNNKLKNIAVGADYQLAPGMLPYVDVNFINARPSNSSANPITSKNKGQTYIFGTQFRF